MTLIELAAYLETVLDFEARIKSSEVADWGHHQSEFFGYPTYEHQSFGYDEALQFIRRSANHLCAVCSELNLPIEGDLQTDRSIGARVASSPIDGIVLGGMPPALSAYRNDRYRREIDHRANARSFKTDRSPARKLSIWILIAWSPADA